MVATEVVLGTGFFSKDMLESPRFTGRAVCALLAGSSAAQTWPLCQLAACAGARCAGLDASPRAQAPLSDAPPLLASHLLRGCTDALVPCVCALCPCL